MKKRFKVLKNSMLPFVNISRVNGFPGIDEAYIRVMRSSRYILGAEVEGFEREFAEFCNVEHAVGVACGTDALTLSLKALGITIGDAVFTVANSAPATVIAIRLSGATPIFVDVDPRIGLMSPEGLKESISMLHTMKHLRPMAVVPVHLYGNLCPMDAIMKIASSSGLRVVEDASHAHGASNNKMAGTFGDLGAFSFYPTKPLGALGDGGAVITNNSELADIVRKLRNYGSISSDKNPVVVNGSSSRLDEIQAAFLRAKLPFVQANNAERSFLAEQYLNALNSVPGITCVMEASLSSGSHHMFPILVDDRSTLIKSLHREMIETKIRYQKYPEDVQLPATEAFTSKVLCLPLWNGMSLSQINHVVESVKKHARSDSGHVLPISHRSHIPV